MERGAQSERGRWASTIGGVVAAGWVMACSATPPSAAPSPTPPTAPRIATAGARTEQAVDAPAGSPTTPAFPSPPREGMVLVPGGAYWSGCDKGRDPFCRAEDEAFHQVHLPDYQIDRLEVTVRDFARCVEDGGCDATRMGGFDDRPGETWTYCNWGKPGKEDHPINCVSWNQADAFCRWAGKRLPTEAEWEKAARGTDQRAYPWGDAMITCDLAVTNETGAAADKGCGLDTTQPVGSRPTGASPYGVLDIVGNVWEWTADRYVPPPGATNVRGDERVGKGGCWGSGNPWNSRISWSHHYPADYRSNVRLGFRCAADADAEAPGLRTASTGTR